MCPRTSIPAPNPSRHEFQSPEPPTFFYAVQQRFCFRERLYRVYVHDSMLAGAYVAGLIHDDLAVWEAMGRQQRSFRWLALPMIRRIIARRMQREAFYDGVDPFAEDFVHLDRRNFQIDSSQLVRLRFQFKHLRRVNESVGVLHVATFAGAPLRLVVIGNVDPQALVEQLRLLDRAIEVSGSDSYRSPDERRAAHAARDLRFGGISGIVIGIVAALVWGLGLLDSWKLPAAAVFCIVSGIGAMRQARKMSAAARQLVPGGGETTLAGTSQIANGA